MEQSITEADGSALADLKNRQQIFILHSIIK